jgi:hypothetical protein
VLLDHPADSAGPCSIKCYFVEVQDFTAAASGGADAKRFKVDPQRLLYSLQWRHNATPPDPHLQLVRDGVGKPLGLLNPGAAEVNFLSVLCCQNRCCRLSGVLAGDDWCAWNRDGVITCCSAGDRAAKCSNLRGMLHRRLLLWLQSSVYNIVPSAS